MPKELHWKELGTKVREQGGDHNLRSSVARLVRTGSEVSTTDKEEHSIVEWKRLKSEVVRVH